MAAGSWPGACPYGCGHDLQDRGLADHLEASPECRRKACAILDRRIDERHAQR